MHEFLKRRRTLTLPYLLQIALIGMLAACQTGMPLTATAGLPTRTPTATSSLPAAEASQPPTAVNPNPTPTPEQPVRVWLDPALPKAITEPAAGWAEVQIVSDAADADFELTYTNQNPAATWVFALVAPFDTVLDEVSGDQLRAFWQGQADFPADSLVMSGSTLAALSASLGKPTVSVQTRLAEELVDAAWAQPSTWAVVPFEEIQPRWKVIAIDGLSPLHKDLDAASYLLSVGVGLVTPAGAKKGESASLHASLLQVLPPSNRLPEKLTTVVLTGVTAMVRATAKEMELYGITRPADEVGALLRGADITHISNEIPFVADCPPPRWVQEEGLVFCSDDRYMDLLREVGTDVVELTGDHFQDFGPEAMLHTLELYDKEGWPYYGGGKDLAQARQPLKLTHNGNKIAFLGCNAKAPGYATASETNPGAYHCDMAYMTATVKQLVSEGYLPIVTFQHVEVYQWEPTEQMTQDFQQMVAAGAVIVSGSQAHRPQIIALDGGSLIHYGLGNLFFDQMGWFEDSDKAFIDRHVFYDGAYLGVELLTVQFFDYSQPVWMTPEARADLLGRLFTASALR